MVVRPASREALRCGEGRAHEGAAGRGAYIIGGKGVWASGLRATGTAGVGSDQGGSCGIVSVRVAHCGHIYKLKGLKPYRTVDTGL